jgi:spermidine synthase
LKKSNLLDEAKTPEGGVMALYERDGDYAIRINGVELMSTRRHASEERLAELVCTPLAGRPGAHVLIGGLGFGFTARAALKTLGKDARVTIAELMTCVVDWNRRTDLRLAADVLADRRVTVVQKDVSRLLGQGSGVYDGVILDVDNGPRGLTIDSNDDLYSEVGLQIARAAIKPGGVLGIWSAQAHPRFEKALSKAGFHVTVERATAHVNGGGWHTLFLGARR